MTSEFETDLALVGDGLREERRRLLEAVDGLTTADLSRGKRGGWNVRAVLDHIIGSEWHYAAMVHRLRERPSEPPGGGTWQLESQTDVWRELERSRAALLLAFEGIDEDSFYRLGRPGGQDYSVLSVLQNVRQHDIEHGEQIAGLLASR